MTSAPSPAQWQAAVLALLGMLLALAVWSDARHRRIPNILVLVTLLTGLLLHVGGPEGTARAGLFTDQPGALGLWRAAGGALLALLIFLPFWLLRVLGAGDVKLFAAVGAFAGPVAVPNLALCVLLAGGVLALARLALFPGKDQVRHNLMALLGQLRPGTAGPGFDPRTQTAWRMPYGVAIAGGVAGYAAWTLSGRAPLITFG